LAIESSDEMFNRRSRDVGDGWDGVFPALKGRAKLKCRYAARSRSLRLSGQAVDGQRKHEPKGFTGYAVQT